MKYEFLYEEPLVRVQSLKPKNGSSIFYQGILKMIQFWDIVYFDKIS